MRRNLWNFGIIFAFCLGLVVYADGTPNKELECYCAHAVGKAPLVKCYAACTDNCGDDASGCQDHCDKGTKCKKDKDAEEPDRGPIDPDGIPR